MKTSKRIFISFTVLFILLFISFNAVSALEKNDYDCTSTTVTSDSNCIKNLNKKFAEGNDASKIFELKYTFEVTGLSGGVGGDQ